MSRTKESHCLALIDRFSIYTLSTAVTMILNWYVTWNVAASRFEIATYCRLFAIVYSPAGRAIFQLSPAKIAFPSASNIAVAGIDRGIVWETSYKAIVRHTANRSSSTRKTAVEGR